MQGVGVWDGLNLIQQHVGTVTLGSWAVFSLCTQGRVSAATVTLLRGSAAWGRWQLGAAPQ